MVESQSLQPHYAAGVRGAQSLLFPSCHLPGDEDREGHGGVEHGADGLVSDEDIVDGGALV